MIRATRRPIRPKPLMPIAYPIDRDDFGATRPAGPKAHINSNVSSVSSVSNVSSSSVRLIEINA